MVCSSNVLVNTLMNTSGKEHNMAKERSLNRTIRKASSRTLRTLGILPAKDKRSRSVLGNSSDDSSDLSLHSNDSFRSTSSDSNANYNRTEKKHSFIRTFSAKIVNKRGQHTPSDTQKARLSGERLPALAESLIYDDSSIPLTLGEHRRPSSGSAGSAKIKRRSTLKADSLQLGMDQESADFLDFVLKTRGIDWLRSFRRLDPRFQILKFFNDVAQEGADKIETSGLRPELVSPILRAFQRSSVFTVWRPTSFEAMKKMMLGQGTGKGLDVKGKSAKRGKLSSYVPFMQIHEEQHKKMVRTLPKGGRIRIFYKKRKARNMAIQALEPIKEEMMSVVEGARAVLDNDEADEDSREEAMSHLLWDMDNPTITMLDDYNPRCFGIEVPERLFWEGFCMRQDISRESGSEYETGRPSQPSFQDMNFGAIRNKGKGKEDPVTVVWQYTDPYSPPNEPDPDPMLPQTLLMAYEEHGRVLPVVSDFDCFLVGTRGVQYTTPVPPEQIELLKWSISKTEEILKNPVQDVGWTGRWLEILKKKKTVTPPMPRYGYGDSKSYSIMECAVTRLVESGAVRHGAECFNYGFPQELDEELLIISDTFEIVPWKYVNVQELQDVLVQKIKEGFTFPLNPKWILCDPGWKIVYDKLCASQRSNVQNSLDCWFPPESGLRERIEQIHSEHPKGFMTDIAETQTRDESMVEGTTAMDLAELELARAESLSRAKKKLRLNMIWVHLLNEVRAKNAQKSMNEATMGKSYRDLIKNMREVEQEAINEGIQLHNTSVIRHNGRLLDDVDEGNEEEASETVNGEYTSHEAWKKIEDGEDAEAEERNGNSVGSGEDVVTPSPKGMEERASVVKDLAIEGED